MVKIDPNIVIEIYDLLVSYNNKPVLWDINLKLPKNKIISIIGPNGAGKSTLLKAIMGLISIDNGYVKILKKKLNEVRKRVSYVPQRETVDWDFPASVFDVVMMGRYQHIGFFKRPGKKDEEIVLHSLEQLGISALRNRQISQLSGGQQQRVFLARALAQESDVYLMDEPFSAIDIATENAIIDLFKKMVKQQKTIIVVHHDIYSVKAYFDWTVLLNMHIIASGLTNEVLTSENFKRTYGSQLSVLSEVGNLFKNEGLPIRNDKI
ncbi:MAG: metal ABC transporter ATP-binding protein [Candidatus Thorarchaeota archaeon]